MLEQIVCNVDDVQEGEMKQFEMGPGKVLISKYKGRISAVSSKCTHYGAPLATGAFKDGKVRCPWHGACFNTETGDIEDYPGLDSLHKFHVEIKEGKVHVSANPEDIVNFRRVKDMEMCCSEKDGTFLIIGGGGSAIVCAETLRQHCFKGRIIIATQEIHVPYDRPKLSKMLACQASKLYLRGQEFLDEKNIEMAFNKIAVSMDPLEKQVSFADGTTQRYDKLYVATGGQPKKLPFTGSDLSNIFYLRTPEDANTIDAACVGKDIVILGTGFIGMEMASYFASKAKSVNVVGSGRSQIPFERLLGAKIGERFKKLFIEKGVTLCFECPVKEILGSEGKVTSVILTDGKVLKADVVISGIGVVPSTSFLKNSGINLDKNGYVIVDKFMKTNNEDVFAGGDVASFPYVYDNNRLINIGHWQLAAVHGRHAALNMLGKNTSLSTVPFFWTSMFGKSIRYAGHCASYDEIRYEGDVEELKFAAYYCKDGLVKAVAVANMGAKASEMAFEIERGNFKIPQGLKA